MTLAASLNELQIAIDSVTAYFTENNLTVNAEKSNYFIFHKGALPKHSNVFLNNEPMTRKKTIKYLGFHFSPQLSFSNHAEYLNVSAGCIG